MNVPSFFDKLTQYSSVSVVGTAKNVGKTFCLRRILEYYQKRGSELAITSIGLDGENTDAIYKTPKPELNFYPGMLIQTSETHYRQRHLTASILAIGKENTALGRLVTAQVEVKGRIILSGSSHTHGLKKFIEESLSLGRKTVLIDGALSRMSLASPAVAQAMILCTGAALSKNLDQLIEDTIFRHNLMRLPVFNHSFFSQADISSLEYIYKGIWEITKEGLLYSGIASTLLIQDCINILCKKNRSDKSPIFWISGAVSDKFLQFLIETQPNTTLVIPDFTKLFIKKNSYNKFLKKGGKIFVLRHTDLLAVCVNPLSVDGYLLDSDVLCKTLAQNLNSDVFDLARYC